MVDFFSIWMNKRALIIDEVVLFFDELTFPTIYRPGYLQDFWPTFNLSNRRIQRWRKIRCFRVQKKQKLVHEVQSQGPKCLLRFTNLTRILETVRVRSKNLGRRVLLLDLLLTPRWLRRCVLKFPPHYLYKPL